MIAKVKIDFDLIASRALDAANKLVPEWLPDGKLEGREWVALNPTRGDSTPGSFKVNLDKGVWSDFAADGDGGRDLISLYAFINGKSQGDAAKAIAAELGIELSKSPAAGGSKAPGTMPAKTSPKKKAETETWTPITPIPTSAPPAFVKHSKHGNYSQRWAYRDAQGNLLCYVYRFDVEPKKQILPLTFCESNSGKKSWRWKGLPTPRPLYNLHSLATMPEAEVVFTEGEKAADAAAFLFQDMVATTAFGGAKNWHHSDYSLLFDRSVIVWRDNDTEGLNYARNITTQLQEQRCTVQWMIIPDGMPEKWDAADAVEGGWSPEDIKRLRYDGQLLMEPDLEPEPMDTYRDDEKPEAPYHDVPINPSTGQAWPLVEFGWDLSNDGVFDGKNNRISNRPIWVDALTINSAGRWGSVIKFFDHDWKLKTLALSDEQLHEQSGVLGKELAANGLPILPGKEKMISRFIVMLKDAVTKRVQAASRLGWYDAANSPAIFVMPSQVIGDSEHEIVFQPEAGSCNADTIHHRGSLQDWQKHVAEECTGNPILMFATMLALGGPLLKLCQEQSGGFHLYGVTTGGKTTAAQVAASVWGCGADPQEGPEVTSLRKWYATGNALESIAEVHNDTLLTLDEISEVDPNELGRIIYQLAGGLSKSRANAGGGLRTSRTWRLLFFSTGEKSVRQMLSQVGQTQKGGQRVRLPDIPADDMETGGRAIIVDPGKKTIKDFVQDLKLSCARYYGLAGPTFAAYLIGQAQASGFATLAGQLREELRELEKILSENLPYELPPEGDRVLRRFALVALAGIRSSAKFPGQHTADLLPWSAQEIIAAVSNVRDRWLSDQGQERSEAERGLARLRDQLLSNQDRFLHVKDPGGSGRSLLGYRCDGYFLVIPSSFRELCGEFDMNTILKELKNKDLLKHEKDRLTHKSPTIKSLGRTRPNVYWIKTAFLGDESSHPGDETDYEAGLTNIKPMNFEEQKRREQHRDGDDIPF